MKIVLSPEIALKLENFARIYPKEFSGFGFVERDGETLNVYDIVVLDVGSESFTEIPTAKILELMNREDADKMKLWFHRHPIYGWSSVDENTINKSPLGGIPELVKWSASIVLTPRGWIGRVDSYATKKSLIAEVEPNYFGWAEKTLDTIVEAKIEAKKAKQAVKSKPRKTKKPKVSMPVVLNPEWDTNFGFRDDWEEYPDLETEELEFVPPEEIELDLSPYEQIPLEVDERNTARRKSAWWKRLFQR